MKELWGNVDKGPLVLRSENISALNLHIWQVESFTLGIRVSTSPLPRMHIFSNCGSWLDTEGVCKSLGEIEIQTVPNSLKSRSGQQPEGLRKNSLLDCSSLLYDDTKA